MKYIKYFIYLVKHKYFVFLECCKLGLFWQGIVHDISKFYPDEFLAYANYFYGWSNREDVKRGRDKEGYYKPTNTGDEDFDYAWFKHQKRNMHHWQYWVIPDSPDDKTLVIPKKYVQEMICDWLGAGRAQGNINNKYEWFVIHRDRMKLHNNTENMIFECLYEMGEIR